MKYARIENGIVMEVIDFDPTGKFADEIVEQFALCSDSVIPNMLYVNGEFLPSLTPIPAEVTVSPEIADLYEAVANLYEDNVALAAEIEALKGGTI